MKYIISESQYDKLLNEQEDLCLQDFEQFVNSNLEGLTNLTKEEIFSSYDNILELMNEVQDPKMKAVFQKFLKNVDSMDYGSVKSELKNLFNLKQSLKEQQTPYLEQTFTIGGAEMPKYVVHGLMGLMIIALLSKLINILSQKMDSIKPSRRSSGKSVVGCQGSRARAQAVRRRRRRENWRNFLKKLGLK